MQLKLNESENYKAMRTQGWNYHLEKEVKNAPETSLIIDCTQADERQSKIYHVPF